MSAYIEFFIRHGDNFLPIATYSRGDEVYQKFHSYVPYGQIMGITKSMLDYIRGDIKSDIAHYVNINKEHEEDIALITKFETPIDEKMERIYTIRSWIKENEQSIEWLERVEYFTLFLNDIIEEAEYGHLSDCEDGPTIAPDEYVYAGIEVGNPTVEDIVGED